MTNARSWETLVRKGVTMKQATWLKTLSPIYWQDGKTLPIGTEYKAFEGRDFGYVVLRDHSLANNFIARV